MKALLAILLIALGTCLGFSQTIERSIETGSGEVALNEDTRLEDLVSLFGEYAEVRKGDSARPHYI